MIKKNELHDQRILSATLCILFCYAPISLCLNMLVIFTFRRRTSIDTALLFIILVAFLAWSLFISLRKIKFVDLIIPYGLLLAYIITYVFYPDNRVFMFTSWIDVTSNPFYSLFLNALPAYIIMRRIWAYDILLRYMRRFALAVVACSVCTLLIYLSIGRQPGYMRFSYDLLLSTIILLYAFFTERNAIFMIGGAIGGILIFFCGARGPFLCLLCALLLYALFATKKRSARIITLLVFLLSAIVIIVAWDLIFNFLKNIAELMGVSSRIIEKIEAGILTDDSGRGELRTTLLANLSIFGSGLYGDIVINEGSYAHNFFLELLVHYGLLLGPILIIAVLALLKKGLFVKDPTRRLLVFALFCCTIIKLLLSSSYLSREPTLYALLGLCVSCTLNDEQFSSSQAEEQIALEKEQKLHLGKGRKRPNKSRYIK